MVMMTDLILFMWHKLRDLYVYVDMYSSTMIFLLDGCVEKTH